MPMGDKVGSAWIEVTPVLNHKGLQKNLEKQFKKAGVDKAFEQAMSRGSERTSVLQSVIMKDIKNLGNNTKLSREFTKQVENLTTRVERELERRSKSNGGFLRALLRGSVNSKALSGFASLLPGQIERSLQSGPGAAALAAVGGILIAGIGAGMTAAIQLGVLGGGVALAISKDEKLQQAGIALGNQLLAGLQNAAHAGLAPAIAESFEFLESSGFARVVSDKFGRMFSNLAPSLTPLTMKISDGILRILDGVEKLSEKAGPFMDAFGDGFVEIADDVRAMFNTFADNAPHLEQVFRDILSSTSNVINAFGHLAAGAAQTWDKVFHPIESRERFGEFVLNDLDSIEAEIKRRQGGFWSNFGDTLRRFPNSGDGPAEAFAGTSDAELQAQRSALLAENTKNQTAAYNAQREAALKTANATSTLSTDQQKLNKAFEDGAKEQRAYTDDLLRGLHISMDYEESMDILNETIKKNGKTLDITTPKGRDNVEMLEDVHKAAREAALARFEETGSTEEARKQYEKMVGPADKMFNVNKKNAKVIDELNTGYGDFSKLPENITKTIKIKMSKAELAAATAAVRRLTGNKTLTITTVERNINKDPNAATGGAISGPGTGTSDSIPVNLSNGEFVIKASSAKKIGMANLQMMNQTGQVTAKASVSKPAYAGGKASTLVPQKNITGSGESVVEVNVYIGEDKLDKKIDYRIEKKGKQVNQKIKSGRR